MITRINFIEKKRFLITYQTIATGIGAVVLFCSLSYGLLYLNKVRAETRWKGLQADIERLKAERERIISQETTLIGEGAFLQIQQALEKTPSWSHILDGLTQALPARTWLASIKSTNQEGAIDKKAMIIIGQAKTPQAIAAFLSNLEANLHFDKVVLTTSSEEANGLFQFTVACDIGPKKWILKP